jgi:FixJ family two-component response regulator
MTGSAASVLLVEDDKYLMRSAARLLRSNGYKVVAFATPEHLINRPPVEGYGCLLLDLIFPGISGLELQELMRRKGETLPIVFLTEHGTIADSVRAIKQGAVDFLTKPVASHRLLGAVSAAVEQHKATVIRLDRIRTLQRLFNTLTPREEEVALLVAQGCLNKEVAFELGIVEKTVKIHRGRVMAKLGIRSATDLVRLLEVIGVSLPDISVAAMLPISSTSPPHGFAGDLKSPVPRPARPGTAA